MENYEWAKEMNCAVTVCDAEGIIIYQNDKAVETYKKHGNLIGKNLYECHSERSKEIIRHLFATRRANPISWVTTIIVMPSSAKVFITESTSPVSSGSRAEVGSSK